MTKKMDKLNHGKTYSKKGLCSSRLTFKSSMEQLDVDRSLNENYLV